MTFESMKGDQEALRASKLLSYRLKAVGTDVDNIHDAAMMVCLEEAIKALGEGNFGVGAALVRDGKLLLSDHNRVFHPYFRSDLHAEMSVITAFEEQTKGNLRQHHGTVLYTTVEPCHMCFIRILNAGISKVYYGSPESEGGMMHLRSQIPGAWHRIMEGAQTEFELTPCSEELRTLAADIVSTNARHLDTALTMRGGDATPA